MKRLSLTYGIICLLIIGLFIPVQGVAAIQESPSSQTHQENLLQPQVSGGPDEYGYTWAENVLGEWKDATGGTSYPGLSAEKHSVAVSDEVTLPFDFPFYSNTYKQIYISTGGSIGFTRSSLVDRYNTEGLPDGDNPNNFIAGYLDPIDVNAPTAPVGSMIYSTEGGVSPDRWFAIEWYQVGDDRGIEGSTDPGPALYTFEIVLWENGNIDLNYQAMSQAPNGYYHCKTVAGIESEQGWDGLAYVNTPACQGKMWLHSNMNVRFTRPTVFKARINVDKAEQGQFASPNTRAVFPVEIQNSGNIGPSDTFQFTLNLDGISGVVAVISETNDCNTLVTDRTLNQGETKTIFVCLHIPGTLKQGESGAVTLVVTSSDDPTVRKQVVLHVTVPSPFASIYRDSVEDAARVILAHPEQQGIIKSSTVGTQTLTHDPGIILLPDGKYLNFWLDGFCAFSCAHITNSTFYTIRDRSSPTPPTSRKLKENSDSSHPEIHRYDYEPAAAATPDGHIGLLVGQRVYDTNANTFYEDVYLTILSADGTSKLLQESVLPPATPVNITTSEFPDYSPAIAATSNNRFILAWQQINGAKLDLYLSVYDSNGAVIKPAWVVDSIDPGSNVHYNLESSLTSLRGNQALLTYKKGTYVPATQTVPAHLQDNYYAGILVDSLGNPLTGQQMYVRQGCNLDATQLMSKYILVAYDNCGNTSPLIYYKIFNPDLTWTVGDAYFDIAFGRSPSVTTDYNGNGVISWAGSTLQNHHDLYYALVGTNLIEHKWQVLTQPVIYQQSSLFAPINVSSTGYAIAPFSSYSITDIYLPLVRRTK